MYGGLGAEPPGKFGQNQWKLGVRVTPRFHHGGGSCVGKYGKLVRECKSQSNDSQASHMAEDVAFLSKRILPETRNFHIHNEVSFAVHFH